MNRIPDPTSRLGPPAGGPPRRGPLTPGPLGRLLGIVAGTVLAIGALFVSMIAFAVIVVVAAIVGGWLWWRTRDLRKQLRSEMARMQQAMERAAPGQQPSRDADPARGGDVLDGDFIREARTGSERPRNGAGRGPGNAAPGA